LKADADELAEEPQPKKKNQLVIADYLQYTTCIVTRDMYAPQIFGLAQCKI